MKLHNTMSGTVETLQTVEPDTVSLYTCGLTVYSQPHIGNWLGYIYWDVMVRVLEAEGHTVNRTQNITDVGHLTSDDDNGDDKMEKGARAEGLSAWDVAEKYSLIAEHEAFQLLRLKRPTHLVRATDYIPHQIAFAQKLEEAGYTYIIDGEGLYFDTSKLDDYGKLAHLDVAGLEAGKRVAVGGKKLVTDFAIWKFSPDGAKRDMEWDSPWGKGFPGWHLECSVIAFETLGKQIDIHTGGIDHIPIHHTNEIAQTESLTRLPFARTWVHNNHIKVNGTKISKSLGNIITLQDILDKGYDIQAFKLLALSKHYRTEGNFDWEILGAAQNRLRNWYDVAALRHQVNQDGAEGSEVTMDSAVSSMLACLTNDLDTPGALKVIDEAFGAIESQPIMRINAASLNHLLESINALIGIDLLSSTTDISSEAKQLIHDRETAREQKDWQRSDELRDQLAKDGVIVRDTAEGQVWTYA